MTDAYALVKWVHVVLAILAVGFNATYGLLIARAARDPPHLLHTLRTIRFMDDRVANPAYVLLLVTGGIMAWLAGPQLLRAFWLETSLVLYAVLALTGLGLYTPTLRAQIRALEQGTPADAPTYTRLARRGTALGICLAVLALAITFLMVVKPASPL